MIISRAPLRISLAGGGTDLPEFYRKHGGSVTSMAIDKYIYVTFKRNILDKKVRLQYLKTEEVDNVEHLANGRARAVLNWFDVKTQCEITSIGDLPSSSGLGSSGSYTVAMINNLQTYRNQNLSKQQIADLACDLEMNTLNEPVGKQDQYIAAFGDVTTFDIDTEGKVTTRRVAMNIAETKEFISKNRVYWTGLQRDASDVLKDQKVNLLNFEDRMLRIRELGDEQLENIKTRNYDRYGVLLDQHWQQKRKLSPSMSPSFVDRIYEDLMTQDYILGGKLIGAGGGGFLLLYPRTSPEKLDKFMEAAGYVRLDYGIDHGGVMTIYP